MEQTGNSMRPLRSARLWQSGNVCGSHRNRINIKTRRWEDRIFTDECRQSAWVRRSNRKTGQDLGPWRYGFARGSGRTKGDARRDGITCRSLCRCRKERTRFCRCGRRHAHWRGHNRLSVQLFKRRWA